MSGKAATSARKVAVDDGKSEAWEHVGHLIDTGTVVIKTTQYAQQHILCHTQAMERVKAQYRGCKVGRDDMASVQH